MTLTLKCNPMNSLNDALPGPYVPVRVTPGALVTHWYTYAPPRAVLLFLSQFDGVGLAGFKSRVNAFLFLSIGWYCGAGVFELIGCISLSLSLADLF